MTGLAFYRAATTLGAPLVEAWLRRRRRQGREDPARAGERAGIASAPRPEGPLVWIHAASVGESLSVLRLIEKLAAERPDIALLVTTGTVTSAGLMAERLPAGAVHQYVPVDRLAWVRRFLDHWRPDLALWVESEFWPNLLCEIRARHIPLALVNARISQRSYDGWKRWPRVIAELLGCFDLCLAQSPADRDKLIGLGAKTVRFAGNLKYAADILPADADALGALEAALGDRPRWLAASTHPGEEAAVADAHRLLKPDRPGLLTLIVPRHPARGPAIAAMLREGGLDTALRSAGEEIASGTDVYVADTVGELGLFYRATSIAFVGGSLVPHGGQNLLEPARLGCALLYGPHMFNFQPIVDDMRRAKAAATAEGATALAREIGALLGDPALLAARAAAASGVAEAQRGILEAVMDEIAPLLARAAPRAESRGDDEPAPDHAARA
jgi:3-deoxy-D-manno-octulosonic-acid transferase